MILRLYRLDLIICTDIYNQEDMLAFYAIADHQPLPDFPEQADLPLLGSIDLNTYERLINKGIIESRYFYYSDFRWTHLKINEILQINSTSSDTDIAVLSKILSKAMTSGVGVIVYCD